MLHTLPDFNSSISFANFCIATMRLEEALEEYEKYTISSSRDGVIQRFEFCTELAWKSTREYLLSEGYIDINSPKTVMKQAYAEILLKTNRRGWSYYIQEILPHIYMMTTLQVIFSTASRINISVCSKSLSQNSKDKTSGLLATAVLFVFYL